VVEGWWGAWQCCLHDTHITILLHLSSWIPQAGKFCGIIHSPSNKFTDVGLGTGGRVVSPVCELPCFPVTLAPAWLYAEELVCILTTTATHAQVQHLQPSTAQHTQVSTAHTGSMQVGAAQRQQASHTPAQCRPAKPGAAC
jgi:hypothetical protein